MIGKTERQALEEDGHISFAIKKQSVWWVVKSLTLSALSDLPPQVRGLLEVPQSFKTKPPAGVFKHQRSNTKAHPAFYTQAL